MQSVYSTAPADWAMINFSSRSELWVVWKHYFHSGIPCFSDIVVGLEFNKKIFLVFEYFHTEVNTAPREFYPFFILVFHNFLLYFDAMNWTESIKFWCWSKHFLKGRICAIFAYWVFRHQLPMWIFQLNQILDMQKLWYSVQVLSIRWILCNICILSFLALWNTLM